MSRWIVVVVAGAAVVYVGLCLLMFVLQRSLIYFPQPRSPSSGTTLLALSVDGRPVLATVRAHEGPNAMIYFGGNAEDVSGSAAELAAAFPDHAHYLLHYPGFGGAPGKPSEAALVADALALFDRVAAQHSRVVVIGRSLGSGVAVQVASARRVARLVLVTPYDSLEDIAARQFPWLPVRWILLDKFDSGQHAARVTAPTLLIAAENDEVIPRASTDRLLARFGSGVARLGVVAGADHNFSHTDPEYQRLLRAAP
jgi:hypothetical protein